MNLRFRKWLISVGPRLAELMAVNGGTMDVRGKEIGRPRAVCPGEPEYHRYNRMGLTVPEAFELTYLRGAFDALAEGLGEAEMSAAKAAILREVRGEVIEVASGELARKLLRDK